MADESSIAPEAVESQEEAAKEEETKVELEANSDEKKEEPHQTANNNEEAEGDGGENGDATQKNQGSEAAGEPNRADDLFASLVTSAAAIRKKAQSKRRNRRPRLQFSDEYDGEGREEEGDEVYSDDSDSDDFKVGKKLGSQNLDEEDEDDNAEEDGEEEEEEVEEEEDDTEEEDDNEDEEEEDYDDDEYTAAEEAEALYERKLDLIDRYLMAKKDYKYLLKKNAYLQDKLYKICVRKGFIVEKGEGEEEDEKSKKKGKRKFSFNKPTQEVEEMPDGLDEEDEEAWEQAMAEQNEANRQGNVVSGGGGIRNFMEAALESKYTKLVKRIWAAEQSKEKDLVTHDMNLAKIREKSEKWERIHQEKFNFLMDRVREASDICLDSNTGQHLQRWETEQYIEEVTKIHAKLCKTLCKMYSSRHGLEFALKRLEETEVQGEGLQMLEYEQLQAENETFRKQLEDRLKDVDNIKAKIAHAVQILAHFRECLQKLQEKMDDGNSKLALINKRVYQVREITDVVTQRYEVFKDEERNLISESGLLDNTKLLRDFEKTHYDVMDLKEDKRKLQKQLSSKTREIQEILSKIRDVQMNLPELQLLQKKEEAANQQNKTSIVVSSQQQEPKTSDPGEAKRKKIERLQFLLASRNLDPKRPKSKPQKKMFPSIAEPYKCHFQNTL